MLRRYLPPGGAAVLAGVGSLTLLAWIYLLRMAGGMDAAGGMAVPQMQAWRGVDLFLLFVMWAVMMVAMMLPSATPMILLFGKLAEQRRSRGESHVSTAVFVLGYLLAWTGFSGVATLGQWALHRSALLSPMMVSTSTTLGGGLLILAGLYQWTPLKRACLQSCRSPLGWLTSQWREGPGGALTLGLLHGGYCVGCCWALMALLFVAGVMNLLWVAVLAALVLLEKTIPRGMMGASILGMLLVGWGGWLVVGGLT